MAGLTSHTAYGKGAAAVRPCDSAPASQTPLVALLE